MVPGSIPGDRIEKKIWGSMDRGVPRLSFCPGGNEETKPCELSGYAERKHTWMDPAKK